MQLYFYFIPNQTYNHIGMTLLSIMARNSAHTMLQIVTLEF